MQRRGSLAAVLSLVAVLLGSAAALGAAPTITAEEASAHVGETATVCGVVVSAKHATSTRGEPTFLNLDRPYPNQVFTVVIWGSDRAAFGQPEAVYRNKHVCVSGLIESYKGKPEIVARKPSQVELASK